MRKDPSPRSVHCLVAGAREVVNQDTADWTLKTSDLSLRSHTRVFSSSPVLASLSLIWPLYCLIPTNCFLQFLTPEILTFAASLLSKYLW